MLEIIIRTAKVSCVQRVAQKTSVRTLKFHNLNFIMFLSENLCEQLLPPTNGAISCAEWLYGQICTMQCQGSFDIPYGTKNSDGSNFDGKFVCSSKTGKYSPSDTVPNCTGLRNNSKLEISMTSSILFYLS